MDVHLGTELTSDASDVVLPAHALLRHVMALGSSGSGKTVLCKVVVEEAVRHGLPVICIDPQGDLCSLASGLGDPADLAERGVDPARAQAFRDRADVVVFTPASRKGVALCADPLDGSGGDLPAAEQIQARSRAADMIVSLLGYDTDSDDGAGLRAVLDTALGDMADAGRPASRLSDLADYVASLDDAALERYGRYLDARKIRTARQRLARLDVGARRLLFHDGLAIDIEMLLGRRDARGKTRVSVIYLNTLHSQEDKDFFIAALVDRLYAWMLANPSPTPQALFYIDEVAPFVPPVRKPACKPGLALLFKQARKYGVCCLMATQNPGDVDYKSMSQFGTWALGRLTTRQDLKKVEPIVKSLAPDVSDAIMSALPARRPGEFSLLSPDQFDGVRTIKTRWLYSAHETLDEERIEALADERWRERFALAAKPSAAPAPVAVVEPEPEQDVVADAEPKVVADADADAGPDAVAEPGPVAEPEPEPEPDAVAETRPPKSRRRSASKPKAAQPSRAEQAAAEQERMARVLSKKASMSAREFAEQANVSERKARAVLKALVADGHAGAFKEGRAMRYWARRTGARPDLELGGTVAVIRATADKARIERLARGMERSKLLGLIGEQEQFESAELIYRPVYQVVFEEEITRSGLARLVGPSKEQLIGTTYHHATTLRVLTYTPRRGIEFADQPGELASRVDDFDGAASFDDVAPGELAIDVAAWRKRRRLAEVKKYFRERFQATPGKVTPIFVPLWQVMLRQRDRGNYRVVTLDGLVGKPVTWSME